MLNADFRISILISSTEIDIKAGFSLMKTTISLFCQGTRTIKRTHLIRNSWTWSTCFMSKVELLRYFRVKTGGGQNGVSLQDAGLSCWAILTYRLNLVLCGPSPYIYRYRFTSISVLILKIRRPHDHLIFIMGMLIPGKTVFILS